jgi:hypothetical protein
MTRIRIIVAVLAALALAAPAASADPHAMDYHMRAELQAKQQAEQDAAKAELRARGRDGVQTGSLAGTTDATARAYAQEKGYSSYGAPEPVQPAQAPTVADDDSAPWTLLAGFVGIALLFAAAVLLVARPRRPRVAT